MRRRTAVLLALASGALVLATAGQTWVEASGLTGGTADHARAVGASAAPVATAMAVVVMAGALALTTARRVGAVVVGLLTVLAGVVIASSAVVAALDPVATATPAVAAVTGTTADAASYAVTVWPWVCAAAGVLAALTGAAALASARSWRSARRYEAAAGTPAGTPAGATAAPAATVDEMDAWDDLSRGHDPT